MQLDAPERLAATAGAAPPAKVRDLADRAFARASGALPIDGNAVRLLLDSGENYPAWLAAIESAMHTILFEMYILADDRIGRRFADALADRARAGVAVHVVVDWLGTRGAGNLLSDMRVAGVHVRVFNPPQLRKPARLGDARPSQDDHRRRPHRIRQRPVRQRQVGRRSRAADGAVARHGHRDPRPGRGRSGDGVRAGLAGVRRAVAAVRVDQRCVTRGRHPAARDRRRAECDRHLPPRSR